MLVTGTEDAEPLHLSDLCIGSGVLQFRHMDEVSLTDSGLSLANLAVGDLVYVTLDQSALIAFLDQALGTADDGTVTYGRTGLSFEPSQSKMMGHLFVIGEIEPDLRFTEPFPEDISNDANAYVPFNVCIIPGRGKVSVVGFRYFDQVSLREGEFYREDFSVGDLVYVQPNQPALAAFLDLELGTDEGTTYYGRTGLSFDPQNPSILGQLFVIAETEPNLRFTEPYPEKIRNSMNSVVPFNIVLISKPD
ncbi:hypothetical protein ACFLSW_05245 [Candidatus Bipolaricaulota bacterium]